MSLKTRFTALDRVSLDVGIKSSYVPMENDTQIVVYSKGSGLWHIAQPFRRIIQEHDPCRFLGEMIVTVAEAAEKEKKEGSKISLETAQAIGKVISEADSGCPAVVKNLCREANKIFTSWVFDLPEDYKPVRVEIRLPGWKEKEDWE